MAFLKATEETGLAWFPQGFLLYKCCCCFKFSETFLKSQINLNA